MSLLQRSARRPSLSLSTIALGGVLLALVATLVVPVNPAIAQGSSISLGRPIEVDLIPPGVITADGSTQRLTFVVTDEMGALAEDVRFRGSNVDAGKLSSWEMVAPGIWVCDYTPPNNSQVREAKIKIKAKVGGKTANKQFMLQLQPSPVASFTFEANPPQIVLNRDPNSSLVFTVAGQDGGPLDGLNLRVDATAGSVQNVQGMGGGKYQALYTPPPNEIAPKVALLSVIDNDHPETAVGFFTMPLVGNINWQVNTGLANVKVMLDVGAQRFGPFQADATGVANAPILVPPGVGMATATVIMPDGSSTAPQAIDLMVPPFKRIKFAPPAAYVPGDGAGQYPLFMYVVDALGAPLSSAQVEITTTGGTVTPVKHLGNGVYQALFTPPLVRANTPVTITASLPGMEQDVDTIGIEAVAPMPSELAISSSPGSVAGGSATVSLTGTVKYADGGPADYLSVAMYNANGAIAGVLAQGNGVFNGSYSDNFDQHKGVLGLASMPALSRPAEAIIAWPVSDQVATNRPMAIVAMAVDRYGLPVSGVPLSATVIDGGGSITGGGNTDSFGRVVFQFTAAPLGGLSQVQIAGSGLTYHCPVWQTKTLADRFEFPPSGGATQLRMMEAWGPLKARMLFGGNPSAAAVAPTVAPVVTPVVAPDPTVTSGGTWGATEPTTTEPTTTEPTTTEPTATEPTTTEPATTEPATTEPATTEPATTEPATTEPATTEPTTTEPVETTPPPPPPPPPTVGPATSIEVTTIPDKLPKDGHSTASIIVRILDSQGQPVPGEQVVIVASGGSLTNKTDNGDGTFSAVLTAPKGGNDSQINISATRLQGDLSAWATIALGAGGGGGMAQRHKEPKQPKQPKQPRTGVTAPAPGSSQYRIARVLLRYPLAGYMYDMEPGMCGENPCGYFPDMDVVGPESSPLVGIPESIGFEGEVFPIEYAGAHVGFDRYGYRTDFEVTGSGGSADVFKDGMYHIMVGGTGRLPLFKNAPVGPLDILLDLGYHAQDVVVFHGVGEEDNTWTWENLWLHGFRLGFGARFQIVPFAQVHGSWHGTIIGSGLITNVVAIGGTFRVWKGLTFDARYQGMSRNLHVTSSGRPDEGDIHEESHGLILGAGWSF